MTVFTYNQDDTVALFIDNYCHINKDEAYELTDAINKAFLHCKAYVHSLENHPFFDVPIYTVRLEFDTLNHKKLTVIANNVHWFVRGRRSMI